MHSHFKAEKKKINPELKGQFSSAQYMAAIRKARKLTPGSVVSTAASILSASTNKGYSKDDWTVPVRKRTNKTKKKSKHHPKSKYASPVTKAGKKRKKKKKVTTGLQNMANKFVKDLKKRATHSEKLFQSMMDEMHQKCISQHVIYNEKSFYIIDFYFPEKRLCVEIDGGYHSTPEQTEKDRIKDRYLYKKNYSVVRITNEEMETMDSQALRSILSIQTN